MYAYFGYLFLVICFWLSIFGIFTPYLWYYYRNRAIPIPYFVLLYTKGVHRPNKAAVFFISKKLKCSWIEMIWGERVMITGSSLPTIDNFYKLLDESLFWGKPPLS